MTQPEALRLATALEKFWARVPTLNEAAAELRRLHAQRDALLEALKWCVRQMPEPVLPGAYKDGYKVAIAAIKAVEENT